MKGIYVLTNSINSKAYVGLDNSLPSRANQHLNGKAPNCPAIHNAIKKHGRDAFTVEIIAYPGASHAALCAIEKWHIAKRNTKAPNGYNLTDGGDGSLNPSDETRQKMSESKRGEKHHFYGKKRPDFSLKVTGQNNPFYGKHHTPESKAKMSESHSGKVLTDKTKAKMSKSRSGTDNHFYGKEHTPDTKAKMSKSQKERQQREKRERLKANKQGTLF